MSSAEGDWRKMKRGRRSVVLIMAVTVIGVVGMGGCGAAGHSAAQAGAKDSGHQASEAAVNFHEFGKSWPLLVPDGTLRCGSFGKGMGEVIFTAPDGTEYGLNGLASDSYKDIDPIWREGAYGLKVSIGPLINRGLALC